VKMSAQSINHPPLVSRHFFAYGSMRWNIRSLYTKNNIDRMKQVMPPVITRMRWKVDSLLYVLMTRRPSLSALSITRSRNEGCGRLNESLRLKDAERRLQPGLLDPPLAPFPLEGASSLRGRARARAS